MSVNFSVTRDNALMAWGMNELADGRKDVLPCNHVWVMVVGGVNITKAPRYSS